ncbi:outer membrane lipoprotein-sorting protein [Neptuniibacter sp. CAU 1671]|uniref:outer membrane lipoprotein-sorting protein n=1 Tax=Neptuniibacter sp. CAU 1671 TaxID=3032593 RepID=UPI0023DBD8A6|nr:outer membrane lipoprotein-sorting protein [Neptuniibacter sp. CAU 1671]MDF2181012.1 outer membrane lipoprotein-sorting protein [Neptuniibacter sp. CAU 1671]
MLRNNHSKVILLMALCLSASQVMAETAEEKGLRIAKAAKARDQGWQSSQADMAMILRNSEGQESRRALRIKTLEIQNDGDKSLTIFDHPADVKGTAFLSFSHPIEADEQWLYLPALKRVKRIASRNKSGPFMGSEFAYEDLASFEVEKYRYRYLRDENCPEQTLECYVAEYYPNDPNSGYTRQIVWLDKTEYRPWKIEFYDRKDALLKTLTHHDYKQYLNHYWRPDSMLMENHQTGKSTELTWENYRFQSGLTEDDFNQNSLKRAR